ncbi:MAG: cytochrome c [Deltaproteobacteria bacterium]|nr:cytochrome c [Deltaproteobacteria bacterium]
MNGKMQLVLVLAVAFFIAAPFANAAEKRCKIGNEKVECPTRTDAELKKAIDDFEKEAMDMMKGIGGSTYGIAPFDYLTGVGKRTTKADTKTFKVESGYAKGTGKTEAWDRIKKPASGEAIYNQWTNNWSPSFKNTLVAGADPNEGKQWYYVYCVGCHGWLLHGDGPNAVYLDPKPRILTKGSYMNKKTNVELFTTIKGGGASSDLSDIMPAWGNLLQDQDIWNVIAWIRANADVKPITSVEDYLNPKSSFDPKSTENKVTPLNAAKNPEFKDAQETVEASLAGRGGKLKGAGFVEGGLRKAPEKVTVK